MDKISLPNGLEDLEAIAGAEREPEEMIILLAKKINADGCHIGQSDSTVFEARKILKKK